MLLELQVEGAGTSAFRVLAHEADGPRLALLYFAPYAFTNAWRVLSASRR